MGLLHRTDTFFEHNSDAQPAPPLQARPPSTSCRRSRRRTSTACPDFEHQGDGLQLAATHLTRRPGIVLYEYRSPRSCAGAVRAHTNFGRPIERMITARLIS